MVNETVTDIVADSGDMIARIAAISSLRANHSAVEATDRNLSYCQLDHSSNQLAHRLQAQGIGPECRVGVSVPRGANELVALLAILKAGAAYIPLDPTHPAQRLALIMHDAQPEALIVAPDSPLATVEGVYRLELSDLDHACSGWPTSSIAGTPSPEQLAYIMFTSGSTGRPKGVEIGRGALNNFLCSMAHTPGLNPAERLLAVTTTAFDIAGLELYLPLWAGATVIVAEATVARDPQRLRQRLERGDITTMQATPATWRLLLEAGWTPTPTLRMFCGGEALTTSLADRLVCADTELWNMYGPTETTIWSSVARIGAAYDRITIGHPIDHTHMVVLDSLHQPVAAGTAGELAIGGRGLARGYWGRPDLTAERFITGPTGQRLYRTGDLARELPDGRIECLGRLDHQVKIEGFRVELAEIESRLRAVPGVHEVLVVAQTVEGRPARLVVYWTGSATRKALVTNARSHLAPYMVPSVWIHLKRFALNCNGKIDRRRLPSAQPTDVDHPSTIRRPNSDAEVRIAAIWRDVLQLPEVSTDQEFFTLGGTSTLATRVVTKIRQQTGAELPLQAIYETPTITGLATRINEISSGDHPIVATLRTGANGRAPLFCLLGVHLYQDLAHALAGDQSVIGMHVPCRYVPGHQTPPRLVEVAMRYVELIRRHQSEGPYHLLGLCYGGIVAYEAARQLQAQRHAVAGVTIIDAILPGAIQIRRRQRLRSGLRTLLRSARSPRGVRHIFSHQRDRLVDRIQQQWSRPPALAPVDLPIEGPEAEAEIRRFSAILSQLDTNLLVVRATAEPIPKWKVIDPDQGWAGRATRVQVHDVAADHLGVLREPHVRTLARILDQSASTLVP